MTKKKSKLVLLTCKDMFDIKRKLKVGISVRQLALWWDLPYTTFRRALVKEDIIQ